MIGNIILCNLATQDLSFGRLSNIFTVSLMLFCFNQHNVNIYQRILIDGNANNGIIFESLTWSDVKRPCHISIPPMNSTRNNKNQTETIQIPQ
jgi:hypothetical protein